MSDRRKARAFRAAQRALKQQGGGGMMGGLMPNLKLERRVVTSREETDRIRGQNAELYARVREEQAQEREQINREFDRTNAPFNPHADENWAPPSTLEDFQKLVAAAHPDWPLPARDWEARHMYERHEVIEAALKEGMALGRQLREQAEYGHGWDWPALHELTPSERTWVLGVIYRHIFRDKPLRKRG